MFDSEQQKKTLEILQAIIKRAWQDEAFKRALIENPIETIKKVTGAQVSLPTGKTLVVKDQTDENILYINIPAVPDVIAKKQGEVELSAAIRAVLGFNVLLDQTAASA